MEIREGRRAGVLGVCRQRREERIFELPQTLEFYRTYQDKIAHCDREIERQLAWFEDRSDSVPPQDDGDKRGQGNVPCFDLRSRLHRMTGVDLTRKME